MNEAAQISMSAAEWLVSCYGAEELFALVTADPVLQDRVFRGGFKVRTRTLEKRVVRRRIASLLSRDISLVKDLLLEPGAPWAYALDVIGMLDESWLLDHWRPLVRGTADRALVLGMALDERESICSRGERLLRRDAWWKARLEPSAETIPSHVSALADLCADRHSKADEGVSDDRVSGRVVALERENESLKEAVQRQRRKARHAAQELRQAHDATSDRERELKHDLQEAKHALREAQTHMLRRVDEQVNAFKRQVLGVPSEDEAREAAALQEGGLIEQAERVLEKQSELDRAYGTREALRKRIRQLSDVSRRLSVCIEEAVRLHPDVRKLHAEITREIERLQDTVQREVVDAHTPELAAQLIAEAKALPPTQEAQQGLDRIEDLLQLDLVARLLGEAATERITEVINHRRRVISDMIHHSVASDETPRNRPPREIWNVQTELSLRGNTSITVFVDGYNVTKRVGALLDQEQRGGLAAGREALCELCLRRAPEFAHVEIVFDGRDTLSERETRGALTVVFSNGLEESQNADDYIVNRIETLAGDEGQIWLVTDDRGLRDRVTACCDAFVTSEDWYGFISAKR